MFFYFAHNHFTGVGNVATVLEMMPMLHAIITSMHLFVYPPLYLFKKIIHIIIIIIIIIIHNPFHRCYLITYHIRCPLFVMCPELQYFVIHSSVFLLHFSFCIIIFLIVAGIKYKGSLMTSTYNTSPLMLRVCIILYIRVERGNLLSY
jgi:hypothetical protein